MVNELKRSMTVRLIDRIAIDETAKRIGYSPRIEVGERGVIIKSEGEVDSNKPNLAECRFADCTLIVDRSMVELG